ncbi:MAG TPA: Na+ dependent nucleoside transporter N-terminal domain-containing protein, partial [Candidatus Melainabacteria bacterium]|nr:Na+ dependent nucleoside transporter N-terminal domain-containing protein [Candidatus Melainabacteria bacterium]
MSNLIGVIGILAILGTAFALSNNRKVISWRLVLVGLGGQLVLALMILKLPGFTDLFALMGDGIKSLLDFSKEGAAFVFGEDLAKGRFVFLIAVGSSIIFMSALSSLAYYFGIMQVVVKALAWVMQRT